MRDQSIDLFGTGVLQHLRGQADRVASVNHVVDEHGDPAADVADEELHLFDNLLVLVRRAGVRAGRGRGHGGDGRADK